MADDETPNTPSDSEVPTSVDLMRWERALRQDWPIPEHVKKVILQTCVNLIDETDYLKERVSKRTKLRAMLVIAQFGRLSIEQQKVDLIKAKLDGSGKKFSLADVVAEAEQIALSYVPDEKPAA